MTVASDSEDQAAYSKLIFQQIRQWSKLNQENETAMLQSLQPNSYSDRNRPCADYQAEALSDCYCTTKSSVHKAYSYCLLESSVLRNMQLRPAPPRHQHVSTLIEIYDSQTSEVLSIYESSAIMSLLFQ